MSTEGIRRLKGIATYLEPKENGQIRLVLDDVESNGRNFGLTWRRISPYTSKAFSKVKLQNLELSQEELAEIGENMLIRLLAMQGESK